MISLDQVYLLEQKVESAVEKIQQLQAENDALRSKCNELTNALSVKSEQLSSFESDQTQIETGIKNALDRLNSIENTVLKTASQNTQATQAAKPAVQETAAPQAAKPAVQETAAPQAAPVQPSPAPQAAKPEAVSAAVQTTPSFDTMDTVPHTEEKAAEESVVNPDNIISNDFVGADTFNPEIELDTPEEEDNHDGLGFDIF